MLMEVDPFCLSGAKLGEVEVGSRISKGKKYEANEGQVRGEKCSHAFAYVFLYLDMNA